MNRSFISACCACAVTALAIASPAWANSAPDRGRPQESHRPAPAARTSDSHQEVLAGVWARGHDSLSSASRDGHPDRPGALNRYRCRSNAGELETYRRHT